MRKLSCSQLRPSTSVLISLQLILLCFSSSTSASQAQHDQVYIVYLGHHGGLHPDGVRAAHHRILTSAKGSVEAAMASIIYSYKHSFSGFSARLTPEEAATLSRMPEVTSVFPSENKKMHTTRSWEFLGLEDAGSETGSRKESGDRSLRERAGYGKDIIIGMLDSGIWPESESFKDDGMTPVPAQWKGVCEAGDSFNSSNCNRKLIGARVYIKGYESTFGPLNVSATGEFRSVRDKDGHGTHTASTAGGREVRGAAALGGFGKGTASGGAALARLAIYKVCWPIPGGSPAGENTCSGADMLAAFDDAVADGVHLLSVSIGSSDPQPAFFTDSIAIGSLHAVRYGVLVSSSAGNDGPVPASVDNLAPWIMTVAASSVDRTFFAPLTLGNGLTLQGETVTPDSLHDRFYPLILAGNALLNASIPPASTQASQCNAGSLNPAMVKGKIVVCLRGGGLRVTKGEEVRRAGGAGMILANLPANGDEVSVDAHVVPATAVPADVATQILEYLNGTKNPVAKLIPSKTTLGVKPSPFIAAFSSQGPNSLNPDILKPDISAPGLNILAAWSGDNSPTKLASDNRRVKYNVFSGTSMACPHVSGSAALLKAIHPDWSPAAIKSALMTTASILNNKRKPITNATGEAASPFNMGAGEVNPTLAADPGLVYDATFDDYALFLCSIGYNASSIQKTIGSPFACPTNPPLISNLNLPSVAVSNLTGTLVLDRTVTNVGGKSAYTLSVHPPPGVGVEISPSKLVFKQKGEKQSFKIKLSVNKGECGDDVSQYVFGSFTWTDGTHGVRSPIAVLANR